MLNRYEHKETQWIDLVSPTQEEVRQLMEEFSLSPHIAEELLTPTLRPQVETDDDYFYLVLHFPVFKQSGVVESKAKEVDFIVGHSWIITTRYETIDPLHKFSQIFEVNSVLDKSNFGANGGTVFYYMLTHLYQSLTDQLTTIEDRLEDAEDGIFADREREMVVELSYVGRDLLNLKQALIPHSEVLDSLKNAGEKVFGEEYKAKVAGILGDYYRLRTHIDAQYASLIELRSTNTSLVSTKQNEVMKLFTILAFVTFPLSLFTSIFGMNTKTLPIVGHPYDFHIIIGIMVAATVLFFAYFKYKKWL